MYLSLGLKVQANRLTRIIPSNIYDVRKVDGIRFGVRLSKVEDYMFIYMSHERAFLDMKPIKGDVVLDAGAHLGSYTLRYSRAVGNEGKVISFEPEPDNRRILCWNLELNNARNVEVHKEALGDFTGMARLRISSFSGQHSFVHPAQNIRQVNEVPTFVVRLDDAPLGRVDFVKMDVEGYEMFSEEVRKRFYLKGLECK